MSIKSNKIKEYKRRQKELTQHDKHMVYLQKTFPLMYDLEMRLAEKRASEGKVNKINE